MANKKKLLTSAIALGTAAALTLGGTFAWQSINQSAINESSDINNPGGRLHDDFNGTNKDVYVENFAEEDIFARVRLEEFFEIVLNKGTAGEKVVSMIGTKTAVTDEDGNQKKTEDGNPVYDYTYVTFKDYDGIEDGVVPAANVKDGTGDDATTSWWNWTTGGSKVYMPTFNRNKDSLKADISGEYKFDTGVITDKDIEGGQYTKMDEWEENAEKTAWSVYDIDSNKSDEIAEAALATLIESGTVADDYTKNVKTVEETHFAKSTLDAELISMTEWLALDEDEQVGEYWVYDTDGWVYWASPIKPNTATGLLLDGIALSQVMDNSWYYAINVVAQFCTANDVGKANNTGFYADGETVSENAETLLEKIGVTIDEVEEDKTPVLQMISGDHTNYISVKTGDAIRLKESTGTAPAALSTFATYGGDYQMQADTDYTYEDGILTILADPATNEDLNSYGTRLLVESRTNEITYSGAILLNDDGKLTLDWDEEGYKLHTPDGTTAPVNKGVTIQKYDGTAPESISVYIQNGSYPEGNEHYTYADGVLTVTDADWVGKWLEVKTSDDGKGWLIVTAADNSSQGGGNNSAGGSDTETLTVSLTSSPAGTKTTTNDDGNTVFYCMSDETEEDAVYQFTTNAAAGSTVTWKIDKSYDTYGCLVKEADESGVQKVMDWSGTDEMGIQLDTKTGKLSFDKSVLETPLDLILTATVSKAGGADETVTFEVSQLPKLSIYLKEDDSTTDKTSAALAAGDEIKVTVTSSAKYLFGKNDYAVHYELVDGSCASIVLGDNDDHTENTISRSGDISCDKTTSTVHVWIEMRDGEEDESIKDLPWFCADFTVTCS